MKDIFNNEEIKNIGLSSFENNITDKLNDMSPMGSVALHIF